MSSQQPKERPNEKSPDADSSQSNDDVCDPPSGGSGTEGEAASTSRPSPYEPESDPPIGSGGGAAGHGPPDPWP